MPSSNIFTEWTQMRPPPPSFTEEDLPDLSGRVYLITGASTGVGLALTRLLYKADATVLMACRNAEAADVAAARLRSETRPDCRGRLEFVPLHLDDLRSVAECARTVLARGAGADSGAGAPANRLDVLFCNAGVMHPPQGSVTAQGHELQVGVNCLGHVLLAEMLVPLLERTASMNATELVDAAKKRGAGTSAGVGTGTGSVRVVWVSSLYAETGSPEGGFDPDNMGFEKRDENKYTKYSVSKAGVFYQGVEFGRRHGGKGILSLTVNPGNLASDLQRHSPKILKPINKLLLFPAVYGAYSELFAGLSPNVTMDKAGSYLIPWGRFHDIRADLATGAKSKSDGGTALSGIWYEWCLQQVASFSGPELRNL